jgi:hypothetical protein
MSCDRDGSLRHFGNTAKPDADPLAVVLGGIEQRVGPPRNMSSSQRPSDQNLTLGTWQASGAIVW